MNTAVISLGGNTAQKELIVPAALRRLGVDVLEATDPYVDPDDNQPSAPYLNILAIIETPLDYDTLRMRFKGLEREAGRTPGSKSAGLVPLDIDIVVFNGEIKRPLDFNRPYFSHGYSLLSITRP